MEAIIRDSGRQFKVTEGLTIDVDYRAAEPGATVEFGEVLLLKEGNGAARIGTPLVEGAKVIATVVGDARGPKLIVTNFRRRKNSRRRIGHRQIYTQVKIDKIEA